MSSGDPFRLGGKVALVPGAGRGLGRGIALALAGAGGKLILNSRSPAELDEVAAEIKSAGGNAPAPAFDVPYQKGARAAGAGVAHTAILRNKYGVHPPHPVLAIDAAGLDPTISPHDP